ncbi:MAG: succinyl-diaminopimelate desuccinylase [Lentisphaeraceae bacterium]|nr:succinyl-diaminopimelate desuccinylase [Lentisphaeraceae bacterium]
MINLLEQLLTIPSPTFKEQEKVQFIKDWCGVNLQDITFTESFDSIIINFPQTEGLQHISLVGHSDVVPTHFTPYKKDGRLHGSGASDMLGAVACYLYMMKEHGAAVLKRFNISILIYAREEGTPLVDNGLYDLIANFPEYFESVDLAIVGEPTDNTIQVGCVGSLHAKVVIKGLACHSARPWNGTNALYKALPFIQKMSEQENVRHSLFGVDFFDVMQITESHTEPGRTSLPGYWEGNVNFRFAPVYTGDEAEEKLLNLVNGWNIPDLEISIKDTAPAGSVIESHLFSEAVAALEAPIEAKQAWTDVAQLSAHKIAAFNFGPGLTSQAHKEDEFIMIEDVEVYYKKLIKALT